MKEKCTIFDLDGTLANIDHRLHMIKKEYPDWDEFNRACVHDTVVEPIAQLLRMINNSMTIIICTCRRENVKFQTKLWLETNNLPSLGLMMRKMTDDRSDCIIKLEMLHEIQDEFDVFMAFDDRDSVVQMYRDQGIQCCQVKNGDY